MNLKEILSENVYGIINKFKAETKGNSFATWDEFRKVMFEVLKNIPNAEQEIANLWGAH